MRADCHIHMVLDGVDWKSSIARGVAEDHIRNVLAAYKDLGYTYLRDGGDRWGVGQKARELAGEYGIVYRTPLAPLCLEGHYGSFIGLTYKTPLEYAKLVVAQKEQGADFVKIMISGLMDFDQYGVLTEPGMEEGLIGQLIHIAHEEGMAVMAHCNGAETARAAAAAGVDSIEHGAYLNEDALSAMATSGAVWVPTVSTVGNLKGKGRFREDAVCRILEDFLEKLEAYRNMGGLLAPGTDAGAWSVPHGCQTEEGWLAMAGVTEQMLQKGTAVIMEKFKTH